LQIEQNMYIVVRSTEIRLINFIRPTYTVVRIYANKETSDGWCCSGYENEK
jgi:hypothetical protein